MSIHQILTEEARAFLDKLHHEFEEKRQACLENRQAFQYKLEKGQLPAFKSMQNLNWQAACVPDDLKKRWVEITGPAEKKTMINALNSLADVFMADFEDSLSPTWNNIIEGQINLIDAMNRTLKLTVDNKEYKLNEKLATLIVRPRGLHLHEKNYDVNGSFISASLFDIGLYLFHNHNNFHKQKTGPYFYLPKLENHLEARLFNEIFSFSEMTLQMPKGSIKATVLIETILAVFEMDAIIYELKDYIIGLNAGRWDYIFSIIKKFSFDPLFVFPHKESIGMTASFMRAYTELLIQTCHRRNIYAIGGMAAEVPNRKDPKLNQMAKEQVAQDKMREVQEGFDGTWVAHPDLIAMVNEIFSKALNDQNCQLKKIPTNSITPENLLNFSISNEKITMQGVCSNISIVLTYLASWLGGKGALQIHHKMEDMATCEISRALLWQWVHHKAKLFPDEKLITEEVLFQFIDKELEQKNNDLNHTQAARLLKETILRKAFTPFITLEAYQYL